VKAFAMKIRRVRLAGEWKGRPYRAVAVYRGTVGAPCLLTVSAKNISGLMLRRILDAGLESLNQMISREQVVELHLLAGRIACQVCGQFVSRRGGNGVFRLHGPLISPCPGSLQAPPHGQNALTPTAPRD
jgi:hypothetical protein